MINSQQVTAAVLTTLQSGPDQVRTSAAPQPAPALYGVLERPPGSTHTGTLGRPHQTLTYRCRIRSVSTSTNPEAAASAAEALGYRLAAIIATTRLTGPGWATTGAPTLIDGGVDREANVANHILDVELTVVPAATPASPPAP